MVKNIERGITATYGPHTYAAITNKDSVIGESSFSITSEGIFGNNINRICIGDTVHEIELSEPVKEKLFAQFLEKLNVVPTVEHKCHNCGGILELKATEHIFKCPFCNSVYAIGTQLVNDVG